VPSHLRTGFVRQPEHYEGEECDEEAVAALGHDPSVLLFVPDHVDLLPTLSTLAALVGEVAGGQVGVARGRHGTRMDGGALHCT
jgi:hypothetical protein